MTSLALSQTVISSDVVGSSGERRRQSHLDSAHNTVLDLAFSAAKAAGQPLVSAFRRVDGDSATMVISAEVSRSWILADFVLREIAIALADVNRVAGEQYQLRLRMAVDFGEVVLNPPHVQGDAVVRAARLRDAPALREAMSGSPEARLGVIISDRFYREVVVHGERGLDAGEFQAAEVKVKTFSERGWVRLPAVAAQPLPSAPAPTGKSTSDGPAIHAEVFNKFEERVYAPHGVFGVVRDRRG
ncbi:hypothetical protein GCM10011609_21810 [Lentzea pudingi]|uniref:Guanylate cyclase domain-containing protein n=1 Tax=Lentzea pudingi TaxID=1789439 RepID=A0ABQ2HLH8_9PSEU|nr:hypothetical protein [Lentzea pudingi]GGM85221.1 hypothetical protein GCM10011609_21810 [Lentzea pudingi]